MTSHGKLMPNTAICYSFFFFTNLSFYLSAHPENSLQRRSHCCLGTWTLESMQSMKGHVCFCTERDPYANHKVNREKLKNGWFFGRDLEWFSTITSSTLCEAGIYNPVVGIYLILLRVLKVVVVMCAHIPQYALDGWFPHA